MNAQLSIDFSATVKTMRNTLSKQCGQQGWRMQATVQVMTEQTSAQKLPERISGGGTHLF